MVQLQLHLALVVPFGSVGVLLLPAPTAHLGSQPGTIQLEVMVWKWDQNRNLNAVRDCLRMVRLVQVGGWMMFG
jgi:hypothetical protein